MANKHRSGGIKREHEILEGFEEPLLRLAARDNVNSVIPGRVSAHSSGDARRLTYQYPTNTGAKLLAKTPQAVQEVFVVCEDADRLQGQVERLEAGG